MERPIRVTEGGNAHSPKRRISYYKKRGRQGRRTKLTGDLLRAISDILAEVEILSISHLSQELLARGHSLSRSTVFRAMETLGLKVDRDRKIWCAGPSGNYADQQRTEHGVNLSVRENPQIAKSSRPQNGTTHADKDLFSSQKEDHKIQTLCDTNTLHHMEHPSSSSKFHRHEDQRNTIDDITEGRLLASGKPVDNRWEGRPPSLKIDGSQAARDHPGTQQADGANGHETGQVVRFRRSEFGWRPTQTNGTIGRTNTKPKVKLEIDDGIDSADFSTQHAQLIRDQTSLLHIDELTDTSKDGDTLGEVSMTSPMSSWDSKRRGRKRKSDYPAKFASFQMSEKRGVDTSNLPSTAPPASITGHAGGKSKDRSSGAQEAMGLAIDAHPSVDNPLLPSRNYGARTRETPDHDRQQNSYFHDGELQSGETVGTMTQTTVSAAGISILPDETHSGPLRAVPRQSSSEDSLILEPESCANLTEVSGETDPHKGSKGSVLNRARVRHGALLSRERATVDHNLKRPTVNVHGNFRSKQYSEAYVPMDENLLLKTARAGRQLQPPNDAAKGRLHLDLNTNGLGSSRGSNGQLSSDGKWSGTNTNLRSLPEQHLVLHSQQAGRSLTGDNQTSTSLTNPILQRNHPEHNRCRETDLQTARLHALTSSLAARTSTMVQETSSVPSREAARSRKDGGNLDRLTNSMPANPYASQPSVSKLPASNNVNRGAGADGTLGMGFSAQQETLTRSCSQQAYSRQSLPVNIDGAKFSSHPSGVSVQPRNKIFEDTVPAFSMGMQCCSIHLPEFQCWMQDVSGKLASMEQQLQYLTQIITQTSGIKEEPEEEEVPSAEANDTNGLEEDGNEDEAEGAEMGDVGDEEEEDSESELQTWGRCLPPVNTSESNDMINKMLTDGRWSTLSPYVGGPRLAIKLARDCIFGQDILSRSTVTGRNHMKPLQRDGVMKIKECLMQQYGPKCSDVEREILWKMARESLSQLCKRTRRQFAAGANDQETDDQDDTI